MFGSNPAGNVYDKQRRIKKTNWWIKRFNKKKEKKELFEGLKEIEKLHDGFSNLKNKEVEFGDYFLNYLSIAGDKKYWRKIRK